VIEKVEVREATDTDNRSGIDRNDALPVASTRTLGAYEQITEQRAEAMARIGGDRCHDEGVLATG
jgi:hypothetical protein